jgi:serine phosphatase RsbU (regulator of sigma subunit)
MIGLLVLLAQAAGAVQVRVTITEEAAAMIRAWNEQRAERYVEDLSAVRTVDYACVLKPQTDNARTTRELESARSLQLSMLPSTLPELPGFEVAAAMATATDVGGDFFDFRTLPDGALVVAVGDATGKKAPGITIFHLDHAETLGAVAIQGPRDAPQNCSNPTSQ